MSKALALATAAVLMGGLFVADAKAGECMPIFPEEVFKTDPELKPASFWAAERGIFQGYEDGSFHPNVPVLKRHVALVARRTGLLCPPWEDNYAVATRGQVREAIPGLLWDSGRWEEGLTRSQLLRLMWRTVERTNPDEATAARLNAWFDEKLVTWCGVTRQPRLTGCGGLMVALSRAHEVPLWLALGQCWRESQWGTTGLSIEHNCLWGVKDTKGKWGELRGVICGFADYATLEECVRAYFRLMDQGTYRGLIDAEDWRGLLDYYAPASENDAENHYLIVMTVRGWCEDRGIR